MKETENRILRFHALIMPWMALIGASLALAKVFRAKYLEAITRAGLVLPNTYPADWVVDCKAVDSGEKALAYLVRYLYRGVIQEKDIIACENGQITFRYRNGKTREIEYRTLSGANYGLLHHNSKRLILLIQYLLNLWVGPNKPPLRERPKLIRSCCGAAMKIIRTRIPLYTGHRIKAGVESPVMQMQSPSRNPRWQFCVLRVSLV